MSNPYCSEAQFVDMNDIRSMSQLSNDLNATTANAGRIQRLLDLSAGMLESYLNGRYALPPRDANNNVPAVLTEIVATLTIGKLFARRAAMPKEIGEAVKEAGEWMKALAKGVVSLPGVNRQYGPRLVASDQTDGTSRMDAVPFLDTAPTPTSTGGGNVPAGPNFGT